MSFEFKIPESFLKKKAEQEQARNTGESLAEAAPLFKRQLPSSRLFGNLTRGGPTSVQNVFRTEETSPSKIGKLKDRRLANWAHPDHSDKSGSVSRFKLVRNIEKNPKQPSRIGNTAIDSGEDRIRPSSIFRKRSSSSIAASAAAIKRATKLVRAKRSTSREDISDTNRNDGHLAFSSPSSTGLAFSESVPPPKFGVPSHSDGSKMATRDESVLLRSLLSLVGKHCPTEFDKYQVLEERDKLLSRLRDEESKKNHEKGKKVEGLCLGMCTEKERYVRVVQKRISPYECDSNGLEPSRMVKEYARSAADQDNPLAHELRSKDLLKNTMDYLLAHVLDSLPRGDDDLATWYDFLWSRTRAIRKEITQLMLTDGTAIALFERCSRLHILCAYKLCHLGFDRFDQNMNTENLAKCLQSLRHLYEDLEVQGETFETEAEFRGYDVMLHLHDSNIMRQVLSYRKEVRESQPVRLALQLSSALQNKNYVRFFRLLKKEATFLQCCICHRYFDTVLSNALHTMMTAYGRHSAFLLETAYLVRVLAWDDRDDALNSLALYGVHPNDMSNDQVCFDRDVFVQDPDAPSRPYCWVDAKNRAPWSQVVYGPQLFSFFSIATMTDSFDDSDCYNKDPVLAAIFEKYSVQPDAQLDAMQNQTFRKPVLVTALRDEHREAQYWVNSTVENMVHEVADEESLTICKDINMERVVFSISESLIDQFIRDLLVNIMEEEWKERERERAHIKSERLKEEKVKFIYELSEKLLDEVVDENMKSVINLELRDGVRVYVDATTHLLVEELWRSRLWHSVDKETKAILQKLFRSEMNEITSGLQRFRHQMELLWLRQFWDVWRARVIENRRKRQERSHDWESFQGVWNCRMFSPSNYVGSSNAGHHSGVSSALVDSQKIRFKLKLVQFKKARLKRIMRKYFCKWQYYVENRRALQHLVKKMLYRPKTIGLAPVLPLPFSYARAKRKRTLSPGSLEYSLLERSAPHGIHDTSCDSRFSVSWRQSMEHHHKMLLPERGQYRYDELEITRPFRPPSPEPEEYHVERKECSVDAARYDQKCNPFLPEEVSYSNASEENKQGDEADLSVPLESGGISEEASRLHEKMLLLSNDLKSLIKRRRSADDECHRTRTALETLPSLNILSGND